MKAYRQPLFKVVVIKAPGQPLFKVVAGYLIYQDGGVFEFATAEHARHGAGDEAAQQPRVGPLASGSADHQHAVVQRPAAWY